MKKAYQRRPTDFKRRVLFRVSTSKEDLLIEEFRWLSMIKTEELGVRYYNLKNSQFNHWSYTDQERARIGRKISTKLKGRINGPCSDETKAKIAKANTGKVRTEEARRRVSEAKKGKPIHSDEEKQRRRELTKQAWEQDVYANNVGRKQSAETIEKRVSQLRGKPRPQEVIEKVAKANSKPHLIVYMDGSEERIDGLKAYGRDRNIPYVTLFKASQHGKQVPKYNIDRIIVLTT